MYVKDTAGMGKWSAYGIGVTLMVSLAQTAALDDPTASLPSQSFHSSGEQMKQTREDEEWLKTKRGEGLGSPLERENLGLPWWHSG